MYVFIQLSQSLVGFDTGSIFKQSKAGFNSEFSFSQTGYQTKDKEPNLPNCLLIGRLGEDGFMPFPKPLVWSKTQTASSRIWTQIDDSISYNSNHYVKYAT